MKHRKTAVAVWGALTLAILLMTSGRPAADQEQGSPVPLPPKKVAIFSITADAQTNICDGLVIDHPLTNNNPEAFFLAVTELQTASNGVLFQVAVPYDLYFVPSTTPSGCPQNKWILRPVEDEKTYFIAVAIMK